MLKPALQTCSLYYFQHFLMDFRGCQTHAKGEKCLRTQQRPFSWSVLHIHNPTSRGYLFQVLFRASAMLVTQTHIELGFAVASICCQFEAGIGYPGMPSSHAFNP